ncbi:YigZ family protein [Erysipelothrix urinaevulpis]
MIKTNYKTIEKELMTEQIIKKSKFIAYLAPVQNEDQAKEYLQAIKKEHYKATHHCSAYICDEIERSNDDGEPASSAGLPMLEVLRGNNLNYVIAVVVRYYGGIQLGVGGLIRAYGSSVSLAIEEAELLIPQQVFKIKIQFPYEYTNDVENNLADYAIVTERDYEEQAIYTILTSQKDQLEPLSDMTRGTISIEELGVSVEYMKEEKS